MQQAAQVMSEWNSGLINNVKTTFLTANAETTNTTYIQCTVKTLGTNPSHTTNHLRADDGQSITQ